jgi:hypothetical protein
MSDTLGTNQALYPGSSLTSADGTTVLTLQGDGNLVLSYNGQTLWTSGTQGKPVANLWMNADGNLHLNDGANNIFWSNGASGHKDAFLRINNGGSMMVWDGSNHEIWDSGTSGPKVNPTPGGAGAAHTDFGGMDQFLKEAANTAGDIMTIVGPIVAIVVNVIPGIGQAASLAICAGIAAATAATKAASAVMNGAPGALSAVVSAVATAVPGGSDPSMQAAIQIGAAGVTAAASGQPIDATISASLSAVPGIPPSTQTALAAVGTALAAGVSIASPQVSASLSLLPVNVQAGLHIGAITGNSAVVNASTSPDPATLTAFEHLGLQRESTDPVAAHGRLLAGVGTRGFDIGIGATMNKISAGNLTIIRNQLSPADQKGFDMALALHIGSQVHPPPPPGTDAMASAGYNMTRGMGGAPGDAKASMMGNIAGHPGARPGAVAAVKAIAGVPTHEGWFHHLLRILGLVS